MTGATGDHAQRACALCGHTPRDGTDVPGACARCRGGHVADIADLQELYGSLAAVLAPGAHGEQEKVTGKNPAPPAPLRMEVLNLRGPVATLTTVGTGTGTPSIATVLAWCAAEVRTHLGIHRPAGLGLLGVAARIGADAQLCTRQADRFADTAPPALLKATWDTVHRTREQAWGLMGYRAHRLKLGGCPREVRDTDGTTRTCGRALWVDPALDAEVACRACGTTWGRRHFLWLRRAGA